MNNECCPMNEVHMSCIRVPLGLETFGVSSSGSSVMHEMKKLMNEIKEMNETVKRSLSAYTNKPGPSLNMHIFKFVASPAIRRLFNHIESQT